MFEFDKAKSLSNKLKHGIDFIDAQDLWLESSIVLKSKHLEEDRWILIAPYKGSMWVAIYTLREEKIRIISVRKARDNEKKFYEKEIYS